MPDLRPPPCAPGWFSGERPTIKPSQGAIPLPRSRRAIGDVDAATNVLKQWDTTPYRSSNPGQVKIAIYLLSGLACIMSLGFILVGAWPIAGFLGGEVFLLIGFLWYHSGSTGGSETISLTPERLLVLRHRSFGQKDRWCFNPATTLVLIAPNNRQGDSLIITDGKDRLTIGHKLSDKQRVELARAIRQALCGQT